MSLQTASLGAALLGRTREAVIGLLFTDPAVGLHVREIARRTGFSAPTVARELPVEYLNAAAEEQDPRVYLAALRTVAESQGMANVAQAAGVPRESLYRALSGGGNPRFDTLHAILRAAGFKLTVSRA